MNRTSQKPIKEIAISKFKAKRLSLLAEVNQTKTPLRVTRRGKPLADIIPVRSEGNEISWMGSMAGSIKITGDIVSPVIEMEEIEALQD